MSALWLRRLAVASLMALAISAPIAASWLRRRLAARRDRRRLAWRMNLSGQPSQREQREWMRLCWVLEHVPPYDPGAVAADETEGDQ